MASSLFGQPKKKSSVFGTSGDVYQAMYNRMMATNPAFAEFVRKNQGKSPEQIAQEHGIDLAAELRKFMK